MTMKREIRFKILLPILTLLLLSLFMIGFEFSLRFYFPNLILPESKSKNFDVFSIFDSRLGRWQRRNFTYFYKFRRKDKAIKIFLNSKHLRDNETSYKKDFTKRRIVVLGDSVAWGYGVSNEETFCQLMEKSDNNLDVVNMGVIGYGTGEELLLYRYEGKKYSPDLVILFFFIGNDVENNFKPSSVSSYPTPRFILKNGKLIIKSYPLSEFQKWVIKFYENCYIYNFIRKKILRKSENSDKKNDKSKKKTIFKEKWNKLQKIDEKMLLKYSSFKYLSTNAFINKPKTKKSKLLAPTPLNYYKVELTKRIIIDLSNSVKNKGTKFLVVLSPYSAQFNKNKLDFNNPLYKELIRFLTKEHLSFIDLKKELLKNNTNIRKLFFDRGHYSYLGHQKVASILLDYLHNKSE